MAHVIRAYYPEARLPETEAELAPLYRSVLHGADRCGRTRALLLMDNAASRAQVEPLLCPDSCLLLVTSRTRFTLPGLKALNLDALPLEEAVELVCRIAPRLRAQPRPPLRAHRNGHQNGVPPRTVHGGEEEGARMAAPLGTSLRPPLRAHRNGHQNGVPPRTVHGGEEEGARMAAGRLSTRTDYGGEEEGAAERLARLCGCLPLALRLAASALAEREDLGVEEHLERLRETRGRMEEVEASLR